MARDLDARVLRAAEAVLTDREQVDVQGECWAAQRRSKVPLLFLGRRRYHIALTDRRVLVFACHRGGPDPSDLILGKRYDTYEIEKVRRGLPMFQVRLRARTGTRLVFEFQRKQRGVAQELVQRLEQAAGAPNDPTHIPPITALLETPVTPPTPVQAAEPPSHAPSDVGIAPAPPPPARRPIPEPASGDGGSDEPPAPQDTKTKTSRRSKEPKPPKEPKQSRKERKQLARDTDLEFDEPPDAAVEAKDAAGFWDLPK